MNKKPIVVLISGKGTNLKAIVRKCQVAEVVAVISTKKVIGGVAVALDHSISTYAVNPDEYPSEDDYNFVLSRILRLWDPELIVLAGYMKIIPPEIVNVFRSKIINIHPGLLPANRGLYGINVHRQVIETKEKTSGITIHMVDEGIDTGPIIFQCKYDIIPGTTPEELEALTKSVEHVVYPFVIDKLLLRGEQP